MPAKPKSEPAAAPEGTVRLYPTHRRGAGPLTVSRPAVDGNSPDPLTIDDEGADVPKDLAASLIAVGEATATKPKADA